MKQTTFLWRKTFQSVNVICKTFGSFEPSSIDSDLRLLEQTWSYQDSFTGDCIEKNNYCPRNNNSSSLRIKMIEQQQQSCRRSQMWQSVSKGVILEWQHMTRTMTSVTLPYVTVSLASTLASAQSESMHLQLSPFFFFKLCCLSFPFQSLFLVVYSFYQQSSCLSWVGAGIVICYSYTYADCVHSSHTFGCLYKMNMSET